MHGARIEARLGKLLGSAPAFRSFRSWFYEAHDLRLIRKNQKTAGEIPGEGSEGREAGMSQ